MQFGVSIDPSKPLVPEIESIGKWNLDFVEICIQPPLNTPELLAKKAPQIKKALQANKLFATGHAHPWCDLGSPDITVRAAWLVEMKRVISAAAKLGLKRIELHAHSAGIGFLAPALNKLIMDNFVASFAFLVEAATPHGIAIAVENTWEYPSEFKHLLSKVKGLHATLDIGHAFVRGGLNAIKEFVAMKEIDNLHVHDTRGEVDHLPFGKGKIPLKGVTELLKKFDYRGSAMIEVFGSKAEVKQSLDKFRELMKE
jgi:sugar phosphate isomerase/epimerase